MRVDLRHVTSRRVMMSRRSSLLLPMVWGAAWTQGADAQSAPLAQAQDQGSAIQALDGLAVRRSLADLLGEVVPKGQQAFHSRVRVIAPELADNGLLVPVSVSVDSPMTDQDHVIRIHLLSQRNPVLRLLSITLGSQSGWPGLTTRVRLAGTQTLVAVAELSEGRFHYGVAEVFVTESACVDGTG